MPVPAAGFSTIPGVVIIGRAFVAAFSLAYKSFYSAGGRGGGVTWIMMFIFFLFWDLHLPSARFKWVKKKKHLKKHVTAEKLRLRCHSTTKTSNMKEATSGQ